MQKQLFTYLLLLTTLMVSAQRNYTETQPAAALRRLRAERRARRGICEHQPRSLSHCPRRQRLLARRPLPRRRAADDRWRQHRGHELLRCRKSGAPLQCNGRGQSLARSQHPLPRLRFGSQENSCELH